jgi:hypothetical protein
MLYVTERRLILFRHFFAFHFLRHAITMPPLFSFRGRRRHIAILIAPLSPLIAASFIAAAWLSSTTYAEFSG